MAAVRQGRGKQQLLKKKTFARLRLAGGAVRAADRALMVCCPRHLREQSPFFACAKKVQKIAEYRDTAPLTDRYKIEYRCCCCS